MSLRLASRAIGMGAALTVLLAFSSARSAQAQCGGGQLCAPGAGDCTVGLDCTITVPAGGLVIDLGARRLVLTKNLKISGPAGAGLTVLAGDVLLNGGSITAAGAGDIAGTVTILSDTNFTVQNNTLIDVSAGLAAGIVDLEALNGDMSFSGRIKANGTTRSGFGGDVELFAIGNASVSGSTMDASGGDMGSGGSIAIDALNGSLTVSVPLNAAGGDGGDIEMSAGTTMQTSSATAINVSATGDAGSGGDVDISGVNDVVVGADVTGTGSPAVSSEDGQSGGDGGDLEVTSDEGSVTINGKIDLTGAAAGYGGSVDIEAGLNVGFSRPVVAKSDGVDGGGGDVFFISGGTMSLPQQIDARGGSGSGGSIEAFAEGTLTVTASLLTDGSLVGGSIVLTGCAVNILKPGTLSAAGPGSATSGVNIVQASSTMTITGTLKATAQNLLQYRAVPAPALAGSTITPAATIQLDPTLPCCLNCPVTTTTTSTTTTSTTAVSTTSTTHAPSTTTSSTTPTTSPPTTTTTTTVPSVCGNGVVTGSEQCDDGNTVGGDCCSPTCTFEAANSPCADDSNACTRDVCNGTGVCTHPAGNAGATCRAAAGTCDQAETCTGTSTSCPPDVKRTGPCRAAAGACDVAESCDGTSDACPPDGFASATTPCREAAGICDVAETCTGTGPTCPADQLAPVNTPCRPAAGECDVAEVCSGTSVACPADTRTPNGTPCGDACSSGGTCLSGVCSGSQPVACDACEACDPVSGCIVAPLQTCRGPVVPEGAQLKVKDSLKGPKNDQLQWKLNKGAATTLADFGDPVTSDGLSLCIFDRSQATPSLLFRATVAADGTCGTKPCWVGKGKNFKFSSKTGNADGVTGLVLKPGEDGKAKIQFKAKGVGLTDRPFGLPAPSLPLPLTVQLQSENGQCWQASYQRAGVKKNAGEKFDAKSE